MIIKKVDFFGLWGEIMNCVMHKKYELLVPQEKLKEYDDWNEIFELAKTH